MKFAFAAAATVAVLASVSAQDLVVNTPTSGLTLCQPIQFKWSGGTPPYFLSITNGATGPTVIDFGQQTGTDISWTANVTTPDLVLSLKDSTGKTVQSAAFTFTGTDTSCLSGGSASGGASGSTSAAASGSTTAAGSTTAGTTTKAATTPATTAAGTTAVSSKPASGSSSAKPATSSTSTQSGALSNAVSLGMFGVVSAAILALMA